MLLRGKTLKYSDRNCVLVRNAPARREVWTCTARTSTAFADGCRRGTSPRPYQYGLGKISTEDAVPVRYLDLGQYGLDRHGFGRRTGTICVPARVRTTDQYDTRTSTAGCMRRTNTISDWHRLGTARMGPLYSTLASRYCLGVCQQQLHMLEDAE